MGSGYDFKCKKCKTKYSAMPGIGMMYPRVYQEAVENAKNGKYGPKWQQILNSEEFVAVNAEREIYICSECKHWKTDLNLSLFIPKNVDAIRTKQYGIKTVEEWGYVPYVMGYDLKEEYSLIKVFVHKCKKCGKRMHKAKKKKLKIFPVLNAEQKTKQAVCLCGIKGEGHENSKSSGSSNLRLYG